MNFEKLNAKVLRKGVMTALVVGTVLTLINQWPAVMGQQQFAPLQTGLTYLVPFCVFLWGKLSA